MKKYKIIIAMLVISALIVGCTEEVKKLITPAAIETISEYGVYFGSKAAKLENDKIQIIEVGFNGALTALETDNLDISDKIENLPDIAKKLINEAMTVVNDKFVDLKGKIPSDKVPYVKAIFVGGLKGLSEYKKSINTVTISSGYETTLVKEYEQVKEKL